MRIMRHGSRRSQKYFISRLTPALFLIITKPTSSRSDGGFLRGLGARCGGWWHLSASSTLAAHSPARTGAPAASPSRCLYRAVRPGLCLQWRHETQKLDTKSCFYSNLLQSLKHFKNQLHLPKKLLTRKMVLFTLSIQYFR